MKNVLALEHLTQVTAIGGGHGLGRLLSALSFLGDRLVGVVATTDEGGATGLLRRHQDCIAWGDIRNCLSQLTTDPLARQVLNYRFQSEQNPLDGHNLGNLLLHVLDELSARPIDGIQLLSRLLEINTRVLPMSETPVDLIAETDEGLECFGELLVDQLHHMPARLRLSKPVQATPEVIEHVRHSDLIILSPGSFLTSIMPPLLIADLAQAVADSNAPVIFVDNLASEHSPAGLLPVHERMEWLHRHVGKDIIKAVLTKQSATHIKVPVVDCDCGVTDEPHRHDLYKLRQALNRALELVKG